MKLQNMTVIFIIIMLPIILVTSYYIQLQIDTITMQSSYSNKLIQSAKSSIEAFEVNTVQWNPEYSTTQDSKRRDINASVNTFITSFANALGIGGTSKEYMINYIPAIAYTMYDGYYIYSLSKEEDSSNYTHILQPFVPYTELLTSGSDDWIVINYTLDNYIKIYGEVDGTYINKQGYLISNFEEIENGEYLSETLAISNDPNEPKFVNYNYVYDEENVKIYYDTFRASGNQFFMYRDGKQTYLDSLSSLRYKKIIAYDGTVYYQVLDNGGNVYISDKINYATGLGYYELQKDYSAKNYYNDNNKSTSFTAWFNSTIANKNWKSETLSTSTETISVNSNTTFKIDSNNNPDPESINYEDSDFTKHKKEVIQKSIESSLSKAMKASSEAGEVSYDFRLPKLKSTDWDQLLNNVSIIVFAQGLPIGNKYFNNYAIATSTKNKEYVDPNEIYFSGNTDQYYHRKYCKKMLNSDTDYTGYRSIDYVVKNQDYKDSTNTTRTKYYYSHDKKSDTSSELACYSCLIDRQKYTQKSPITEDMKKKYYTALYRERYVSHEFR